MCFRFWLNLLEWKKPCRYRHLRNIWLAGPSIHEQLILAVKDLIVRLRPFSRQSIYLVFSFPALCITHNNIRISEVYWGSCANRFNHAKKFQQHIHKLRKFWIWRGIFLHKKCVLHLKEFHLPNCLKWIHATNKLKINWFIFLVVSAPCFEDNQKRRKVGAIHNNLLFALGDRVSAVTRIGPRTSMLRETSSL